MKKFIYIFCGFILLVLTWQYLVVYQNFYIDLTPRAEIKALYSANSNGIFDNTGETPKALELKGVVLDSVVPGQYSTSYAVSEQKYSEWLRQIADMGANTITVDGLMDSDFYSALYNHNMTGDSPLYLLQGIRLSGYDANNSDDFYGTYDEFTEDIHRTVNAVHGEAPFSLGRMEASGRYTVDVSQWTIGYILGNEWTPYTVAYTDNKNELPSSYVGEYFSSAESATKTEVFIANIMDILMKYEAERFDTQRLVTFNSSYYTDPLEYTYTVQLQLGKIVSMNVENILPSEKVKSGIFAGYMMRAGLEDFLICLSDNDVRKHIDIIQQIDPESIYGGYVEFLNLFHNVPVVVTSYGFSTARVVDVITTGSLEEERLTETEQGEQLVESYNEFIDSGCNGALIANWQDNWSRTTWNTDFATNTNRQLYWFDTQSKDQANGILAFDTSDGGEVCYVDGDISEWNDDDVVTQTGEYSLSIRYDEGYIYFMATAVEPETPIVIPIDVTPKTGSFTVRTNGLRMSEASDFLVYIDGADNSRVVVQERYEAARANYEEFISTVNPYVYQTSATGNNFVPIRVVANKALDPTIDITLQLEQYADLNLLNVFDTGVLTHGNANPNSTKYNSLADFCFGDEAVEIRIPWQLLNFSDPSEMKVHDDYYPVYGVEEITIDGINVGVSDLDNKERIQMDFFELNGWNGLVSYEERLKKSYDIIKQAWTQEGIR